MIKVFGVDCYEIKDIISELNSKKSATTIKRDIAKGLLKAEKVNGAWVVNPEEFEKYKKGTLAKVISFPNQKGGVGKTTSCQNVASGLSLRNYKVLCVDFDPQANLTQSFGISPYNLDYDVFDLLDEKANVNDVINVLNKNLHLIPAHPNLSNIELKYNSIEHSHLLKTHIDLIKYDYDFIFIDSPPTLSFLTLNTMIASNYVFVPVNTEPFSIQGLSEFLISYNSIVEDYKIDLEFGGVLISKFDKRNKIQKDLFEALYENNKFPVLKNYVKINTSISEAQANGISIFDYKPNSQGAKDYNKIITEILKIVKG